MRYEKPRPISKEEAVEALKSDDVKVVCEAILSLALHEPDWEWVEKKAVALSKHSDINVRGVAATALGHLVRLHGRISSNEVISTLKQLLADPRTAGRAEDALSDIETFQVRLMDI